MSPSNVALGVLSGATWGLASLWVLTRLVAAWIGPARSTRRVSGWLLVKFAVLYPLAFTFLHAYSSLAISFGVGFTVVLGAALGYFAVRAQRAMTLRPHGR